MADYGMVVLLLYVFCMRRSGRRMPQAKMATEDFAVP